MRQYEYYYIEDKKRKGPFSLRQMKEANLSEDVLVWREGLKGWTKYSEIRDFVKDHDIARKHYGKYILIASVLVVVILALFFITKNGIQSSEENKINEIVVASSFETHDDEFSMYIDKFYRDLEAAGIIKHRPARCIVKFSNMHEHEETAGIHGVSFGYKNPDKIEIYINYDSWKKFTKAQKYWVMYHELSHDVLDLDDLAPTSANEGKLMYPMASTLAPMSMDAFIEAFHQVEADYLGLTSIF